MDIFIEKIVAKRKSAKDLLANIGIVAAGLVLVFILLLVPVVKSFGLFIFAGVAFGAYFLMTSRNVEYEYILTNGDLDIDKIIARRKRKRMFSGNCKEFEIVAKASGDKLTGDIKNIRKKLELCSSMDSPDLYFLVAHYKGEKTLVFFEPDERMFNAFKTYIPRKFFQ